jgi:hypothetical protein
MVALRAKPIKKELMPGGPEATRQFRPERTNTSFELIQLLAFIALKVMMMFLPGYFVPGRIARDLDRFKPAIVN